jgi:hypothetical protein
LFTDEEGEREKVWGMRKERIKVLCDRMYVMPKGWPVEINKTFTKGPLETCSLMLRHRPPQGRGCKFRRVGIGQTVRVVMRAEIFSFSHESSSKFLFYIICCQSAKIFLYIHDYQQFS